MANKPVLIVGGICVLLALASFGLAWSAGSQGIEDIENVEIEDYIQGPSTSFTYTYTDDDDLGSSGWYVMMDGEYGDADRNDRTDACENVTFTITDNDRNDVTGEAGHVICADSNDWRDEWADPIEDDGRIVFGYVCATIDSSEEVTYTCTVGEEYTITSDSQLYVFDKDSHDLEYVDGVLGIVGSGLLSTVGTCCCGFGFIFLLVGALTGGAPKPMVGYMPQQGVMPQQGMMSQQGMMPIQGQMPQQPQQYVVGQGIDSSSVADTPVSAADTTSSVWDSD
ncbi:MAG: hypothetical protein CMA72_05510 [Euryarchaeota archaeon]|jgi:hypothetical protein|nr:hypothetical protein [Euryarchaeota archaeon]|tara:strand:+ start:1498 stop:2340 length:843 start_codon:yes stop_codon:yes gene_type:complete